MPLSMSPTFKALNSLAITSIIIVIVFVQSGSTCFCYRPQIEKLLDHSDFVAIVTFKDKPSSSQQQRLNVQNAQPSASSLISSLVVPVSSVKFNFHRQIRPRPRRSFAGTGNNLIKLLHSNHQIATTTAPLSSAVSRQQAHHVNDQMICSFAEAHPFAHVITSQSSKDEDNEMVTERKKISKRSTAASNGIVMNFEQQQFHSFNLSKIIKSNSLETRKVLTDGSNAYTEPLTTCNPTLHKGKEYLIWGKLQPQGILLTLCNSVELQSLTQSEKISLGLLPPPPAMVTTTTSPEMVNV